MNPVNQNDEKVTKTGRRAQKRVFILQEVGKTNDPRLKQQATIYALPSGAIYVIDATTGVRFRMNKDRRSPKARKAERRAMRAFATLQPTQGNV